MPNSCQRILKILSLFETAMNYLQNKYKISHYFLKPLLRCCVKYKSLQMLQLPGFYEVANYYIYFADNSLPFRIVKEFSNSVKS